ncbi:MAG: 5-oxoprolinase subunit PxpB [Alphaproteobacteria bacterium]|nr:5-oxoprolinase subunit PxpB [Alphaproteobacteria bacterium]
MGAEVQSASVSPRFLAAGDTALVVEFGDVVDPAVNHRVTRLAAAAREAAIDGIVDLVPTFRSLMVHYDPLVTSAQALQAALRDVLSHPPGDMSRGRLWRLPTLYGGAVGPDLDEVAERTGLSPDRVIALHSETTYDVYMMGFLPGLPYLGILAKELELPRRAEPRVRVPAGSVAIATNLTNVYPSESPGGWHILGRTPIELFDLRRAVPILLAAGDRIRFEPVGQAAYDELWTRVAAGETGVEPEVAVS